MDITLAEQQVQQWAREHAEELGLDVAEITVSYIWNPGGFVNQSYCLFDGVTKRHVKLAPVRNVSLLKQWASIQAHMSAFYHAPSLIMEINKEIIPGYPYGLVFEFLEAGPLGTAAAVDVITEQVLAAVSRLHKDNVLEKMLTQGRKHRTYMDAFAAEYISRFEGDLEVIQAHREVIRSFVSDETMTWFGSEIQLLKELVSQHPSFQSFAAGVVHNDLNWQNVLVEPQNNEQFWIIDWDNLSANGDAAMDYSVLLWPLYSTGEWARWKRLLEKLTDGETLARVELYFRAKLFDDVIDVLADYIDAEDIPDVKERTQERAKKIHLQSFALYKEKYG